MENFGGSTTDSWTDQRCEKSARNKFWPAIHCRRKNEYAGRSSAICSFGLANGQRRSCAEIDNSLSFGGEMKFKEHDCVVLTRDLPDENLRAGDVGAVIHIHKGGVA